MLPRSLSEPLRDQLRYSRRLWEADRAAGRAGVCLPNALERKYPRAALSWAWHWVFPAPGLSTDPRTGIERRHHLFEERLSRGEPAGCALACTRACMPRTQHVLRVAVAHLFQKGGPASLDAASSR